MDLRFIYIMEDTENTIEDESMNDKHDVAMSGGNKSLVFQDYKVNMSLFKLFSTWRSFIFDIFCV